MLLYSIKLSFFYFRKIIQETVHNPSIDAKSSLELVLLKLRRGLEFGDVIANGCSNSFSIDQFQPSEFNMDNLDLSDPFKISKFIYQTGLNIDQNFFNVFRDNKISSKF